MTGNKTAETRKTETFKAKKNDNTLVYSDKKSQNKTCKKCEKWQKMRKVAKNAKSCKKCKKCEKLQKMKNIAKRY